MTYGVNKWGSRSFVARCTKLALPLRTCHIRCVKKTPLANSGTGGISRGTDTRRQPSNQRGFILLPVVLALALIATIAFLLNNQSAINVDMTAGAAQARQADHIVAAGLAHAQWGVQNSGCAGDMAMTTVPFGQAGAGSYTATVSGGGTTRAYSLPVDQDTWLRETNPTQNAGTEDRLLLENTPSARNYALYRFDLSGIPAGAQINSAIARFHHVDSDARPGPVSIHRVTADWAEMDATWSNQADKFETRVMATIPARLEDDSWVQVNLAPLVQAWVNGALPNHGILLQATTGGIESRYSSREAGADEQPRLAVVVGNAPPSPVTISATGTLTGNPSPASDITRTLTRPDVPAYQPPGTATLQLGADPGEDTILDSFYDLRNYGGVNYLQVHDNGFDWRQYPLIRFDLAGLPRGAAVRSAQLELRLLNLNAPGTATIHQVTRSWVEGTRLGGGTADGATWLTHDGSNAWTSAGGDIDAPVVTETAINGSETWVNWEIAPLVERWLAGEPNYGLLIKPDSALKQARFASRENTTTGVQPRLTISYACECGSPCLAPQGSGNVLLVVSNGGNASPTEAVKKAQFESWGYTVDTLDMNGSASSYTNKASVNDVVYIPESADPAKVGTKFSALPIGVVCEQGLLNDELGIASGSTWTVGPSINVTDISHYITALFPTGPLDIYAAAMEQLTVSGTAAPGLQTLADSGGSGSLVVLDKGADMAGGGTAAGRRVMLPLGRDTRFDWGNLNSNGLLLVQRALQWGTGNTGEVPSKQLLFVAQSTTPTAQEQLRIDLIESWGYSVTVIADDDTQASFDAAVADKDVVYISSLATEAALGTKLKAATIGVVNEQGALVDEFGFGQQSVTYKSRSEIDVLDNTHYITQPFPTGLLTILTGNQNLHIMTANKAPGFNALAQVFNTGSLWDDSLGAIETGGDLFGGGTAAGRRVLLPWGDATFDVTTLNADGLTLMQRAIEWAEGAGGTAPSQSILLVVADSASLSVGDAAKKSLLESWGYTVTLIDDSDSQANFDTAAAAADVAYVSESVIPGTLGTKLKPATIGVVNEDPGLHSEFGFSTNRYLSTANPPLATDAVHYITSPFGGGAVTLFGSNQPLGAAVGTLPSGLEIIGSWSGGSMSSLGGLLVLDTGAVISGGGTAAGRRVQLPWGGQDGVSVADITALTADGQTILQRALEWGAASGGGGGGGGGSGTTVTLSPTQDTFVGGNSTTAYGANVSLFMGFGSREWRPVLQFDVSGVPAGSTVTSAKLRLYNWDDGSPTAGPLTVAAYAVAEAWTAVWGNKGANWYDRVKQGGGALQWSTPGVTYDTGWSASNNFDSTAAPQWVEWEIAPLVQDWIDGANPNYGVVLVPDAGSAWANTRSADFADTALLPQLVVTYQ